MGKILLAIMALTALGCSDGEMAKLSAIGKAGEITCFSGGEIIYHGISTGKIGTESESDGWYFQEQGSGKLIRVSGTCIIRN
jgi:hypothetical protein